MTVELGGTARGTQYDAINVAGKLTSGGTLAVTLINASTPPSATASTSSTGARRPARSAP